MNKIKALRLTRGLTQKQLAEKAGIHVSQVRRLESGDISLNNVTLKNALALAEALGVKVEELIE